MLRIQFVTAPASPAMRITALRCICPASCDCSLSASNRTKCGCGKPIRRVSLKGTGIYLCNCGSSCTCNTVSDKPGKWTCANPSKEKTV